MCSNNGRHYCQSFCVVPIFTSLQGIVFSLPDLRVAEKPACLSSRGADEQTVKGLFGSPRGLLGNGGRSCGREYFCVRGLVKVTSSPLLALLGFESLVFSFRAPPSYGWFLRVQPAVKIQAPPMLSRESWFFHYWHPPVWLKSFRSHLLELWTYKWKFWLTLNLWSWPNTTRFLVMPHAPWTKHLWRASKGLIHTTIMCHIICTLFYFKIFNKWNVKNLIQWLKVGIIYQNLKLIR